MKSHSPATRTPAVAAVVQPKRSTVTKQVIDNRPVATVQRQLQRQIDAGGHQRAQSVSAPTSPGPVVQRLLAPEGFKLTTGSTKRFAVRSQSAVKAIDDKLALYSRLTGSGADMPKREAMLVELANLCDAYFARKVANSKGQFGSNDEVTGERVAGIRALKSQIQVEQSYINLAAQAHRLTATDPKAAFRELFKAKDALAQAKMANHPVKNEPNFHALISAIRDEMRAMTDIGGQTARYALMQDLVLEDVAALKQMALLPGLDSTLRLIIDEVLANEQLVHFQETPAVASGAILATAKDKAAGIVAKYRVDMQMDQTDTTVRLSSLLHELTHVSTQEAFGNTAIHLAFPKTMSDDDVLALSLRRTAQLDELETLLEQDKAAFSASQHSALLEKITYPTKGKNTLTSYANSFHNAKKQELSATEHGKILGLVARGANNTLTEFDTVINQTFFMLNGWKIDKNLDFYKRLKAIAAEAYRHRN